MKENTNKTSNTLGRNLNEIEFPKFTDAQLDFFRNQIALLQHDRLGLDPGSTEKHLYDLQYVSLRAKEEEYEWLINSHYAIIEAEKKERIHQEEYDPQSEYDLRDESEIDISTIQSQL